MKHPRQLSFLMVIACCCLLLSCRTSDNVNSAPTPSPSATQGRTFKLTSPAFNDGGGILRKYTCDGENVSPPLDWSGTPANTKSLVLILNDPDAPGGTWVHWVIQTEVRRTCLDLAHRSVILPLIPHV
jgi:Phosphatidylethanolamine-binding protein